MHAWPSRRHGHAGCRHWCHLPVQEAEQFVRANRFPQAMRARIKAYHAFAAEQGVGDDDARLIDGLSLQLQQDVLLSMHCSLLRAMPFFAAQPTEFMLRIVQVLTIIAVPPGEFVLMQVCCTLQPSYSRHPAA